METTPEEHRRSRILELGLGGGILVGLWVLAAGCSSTDGGGQGGGVGGQGGAGVGGQTGTGGDPRPALLARLTAAEAAWAAGAPVCPTYHYARYYDSFVGAQVTTVQIAEPRALLRRQWANAGQQVPQIQWTEGPSDIESHASSGDNRPPYPASTVAQLFAECRDILNHSPAQFDLKLVVDERGLPTTCEKRLIGYVDDVQSGIYLAGFACGSLDPCAGAGCVGAGPYDYRCVRSGSCDATAVCLPLSDGVSCGAGTCVGGTCQ